MRKHSRSTWSNPLLSIFLSAVIGLALSVLCIAVFSALLCFLLKDMGLADVFVTVSLIVGAFTGAYICGHYRRRHGLILGAVCGFAVFAVISIMGIIMCGHTAGIRKLLLLAVSGMTGGVYGVNSKHPL